LRQATGIGPDVVIEASRAPVAAPAAIAAVRKGGRIILVGIPVEPGTMNVLSIVTTETEVIGSLSHIYDEDFVRALHLLGSWQVQGQPLSSHRISLDDLVEERFERLENQGAETLEVIVYPGGNPSRPGNAR